MPFCGCKDSMKSFPCKHLPTFFANRPMHASLRHTAASTQGEEWSATHTISPAARPRPHALHQPSHAASVVTPPLLRRHWPSCLRDATAGSSTRHGHKRTQMLCQKNPTRENEIPSLDNKFPKPEKIFSRLERFLERHLFFPAPIAVATGRHPVARRGHRVKTGSAGEWWWARQMPCGR